MKSEAEKLEDLLQAIYPVRDMAKTDYPEIFTDLENLIEKINDWQASEIRRTPEQMMNIRLSEAMG